MGDLTATARYSSEFRISGTRCFCDIKFLLLFFFLMTPDSRRKNHEEKVGNSINEKGTKGKAWNRKTGWLKGKDGPFAGWMVLFLTYFWYYHYFLPENEVWVFHVGVVDGFTWEERHNVAVSASSVTKLCDKAEKYDFLIFILKLPINTSEFSSFPPAAQHWEQIQYLLVFWQNVFLETTLWTVRFC